jgi:hypothetical protein
MFEQLGSLLVVLGMSFIMVTLHSPIATAAVGEQVIMDELSSWNTNASLSSTCHLSSQGRNLSRRDSR